MHGDKGFLLNGLRIHPPEISLETNGVVEAGVKVYFHHPAQDLVILSLNTKHGAAVEWAAFVFIPSKTSVCGIFLILWQIAYIGMPLDDG